MRRAMGIAAATALTLVAGSCAAADRGPDCPSPPGGQGRQARGRRRRARRRLGAGRPGAGQPAPPGVRDRAAQAAEACNGARYELQQAAPGARRRRSAPRSPTPTSSASATRTPTRSTTSYQIVAGAHRARRDEPGRRHRGRHRAGHHDAERRGRAATAATTSSAPPRPSPTSPTTRPQATRETGDGPQAKAREAPATPPARAADAAAAEASTIAAREGRPDRRAGAAPGHQRALAERRQSALEAQAAAAAAAAAEAAGRGGSRAGGPAGRPAADRSTDVQPRQPTHHRTPTHDRSPTSADRRPPQRRPEPAAARRHPPPPPPSGGAAAAIGFARAQIGEPYRWGAAGPSSWDCSGLTMGAWQAGRQVPPALLGRAVRAVDPDLAAQLQPGDLLFWGRRVGPRRSTTSRSTSAAGR